MYNEKPNGRVLDNFKQWKFKNLNKYSKTPSEGGRCRSSYMAKRKFNRSQKLRIRQSSQTGTETQNSRGLNSPENVELKPLVVQETTKVPNRRVQTTQASKRSNKGKEAEHQEFTNFKIVENEARTRPGTKKKHKRSHNRSQSAIKALSLFTGQSTIHQPLVRNITKNHSRSSLDHLTFNQIKLERIRQERRIDTAHKRLMVLKRKNDNTDHSWVHKLEQKAVASNAAKARSGTHSKERIHETMVTYDSKDLPRQKFIEQANVGSEGNSHRHQENVQNDKENHDFGAQNRFEKGSKNDNFSPLNLSYTPLFNGVPSKASKVHEKKCNILMQLEQKRRRAQQIRAQSVALEKLKKRKKRRELKKRKMKRNFVRSMEEQSKINIAKKQQSYIENLKFSEWATIQNELSALAQSKAEMRKINKVQRILKKKVRQHEESFSKGEETHHSFYQ